MRVPARTARERVLAAAFDAGIRHFDVARMYGLGAAEAELGRFVRSRRDQVTIATKFGIEPTAGIGALAKLQAPARVLLARFPALRAAVKRSGEALNAAHTYDARTAAASLERSLREVGTDYFDIMFVHGASAGDDVHAEELLDFFRTAQTEGKIRAWGVAADRPDLVGQFGSEAIAQLRYDIFASEALRSVDSARGRIVFGFLAAPLERLTTALRRDADLRATHADAVTAGGPVEERVADLLLAEALDANRGGVALISTGRPERLHRAAAVAQDSRAEDVEAMRVLAAEVARRSAVA